MDYEKAGERGAQAWLRSELTSSSSQTTAGMFPARPAAGSSHLDIFVVQPPPQ